MSDNEGATKKSGYRLEYASSARAKCKGAKPCAGTPIPKGTMRVGSVVDFRGNTTFVWRHWGCTTPKIITNMKAKFSDPDDLDGFDDLKEEDQERVRRAWEEGRVADEDIPPTARKPADDANAEQDEEKPKKKRAPAKKKVEAEGDEEKPKRKRATKPKKTDEEIEDEAEDTEEKNKRAPAKKPRAKKREGESDAEKPKGTSRRQAAAKKGPTKRKAAKDESEASGEDFAEELAEVEHEEDDDVDESAGKKRKRPASTKQAATAKKPRATSSRAKKSKAVIEEDEEDE